MTARISLAALFAVPAAMAYPWHTTTQRWILGIGIAVVIVVLAWWRGDFATTLVRRRYSLWRRNHPRGSHARRGSRPVVSTTVVLEFTGNDGAVPLGLIAGYLDRYGIRCATTRVTSRELAGHRTTWISLTLRAADNLAALRARSSGIPLQETAEIVARRLGDRLREIGHPVSVAGDARGPSIEGATETWRGLRGEAAHLAAYRITVDDRLAETLDAVWAHPALETWGAIEFSGSPNAPAVSAVCAFRTQDRPAARAPLAGLRACAGVHGPALATLDPGSDDRLPGRAVSSPLAPAEMGWSTGSVADRERTEEFSRL